MTHRYPCHKEPTHNAPDCTLQTAVPFYMYIKSSGNLFYCTLNTLNTRSTYPRILLPSSSKYCRYFLAFFFKRKQGHQNLNLCQTMECQCSTTSTEKTNLIDFLKILIRLFHSIYIHQLLKKNIILGGLGHLNMSVNKYYRKSAFVGFMHLWGKQTNKHN